MSFNVVYPCELNISGATTRTSLTTDATVVLTNSSNTNTINSSSMSIQQGENSVLVNVSGVSFSRTSTLLGPTQLYLNTGTTTTTIQSGSYNLEKTTGIGSGKITILPSSIQMDDMIYSTTTISTNQVTITQAGSTTNMIPGTITFISNSNASTQITPDTININGSNPVSISSNGIVYTLGGDTTSYTQQGTSFNIGGNQNNYLNSDTLKTTYIVDTSNSSGTTEQLLTQSTSGIQWTNTIQPSNISDTTNSIGTTNQILDKNATGLEWTSTIQPSNISDTTNSIGTDNQILTKSGSGLQWTSTIRITNISDTTNSIGTARQLLSRNASGILWTTTIKPTNISDTTNSTGITGYYLQKQTQGIEWTLPYPIVYGGNYITITKAITPLNTNIYVGQTNIPADTGASYYLVSCNFNLAFVSAITNTMVFGTLGSCPGTGTQSAGTTTNMCGTGLISANNINTVDYFGMAVDYVNQDLRWFTYNLTMVWQPNSDTGWSAGLWVMCTTGTATVRSYSITVTRLTPPA